MKYKVLATRYGLTLNGEDITEGALATFAAAMPEGQLSHYMHPDEQLPYPPIVGTLVGEADVDGKEAYVTIDFDEDFSRNFDSGNTYAVSVYAMCRSHWDTDTWVRIIDEFILHQDNSVDVVRYGAVPSAKVLGKVEDSAK